MHFRNLFSLFLLAALVLGTVALVGCDSAGPGSTDDPEMGSLGEVNVQMTTASTGGSARAAAAGTEAGNAAPGAAEIEEASVTIAGVELVGEDRSYTLSGEEQEIDLLALEDGVPADLALEEVPPGEYDQLRLDVTDTRLLLSDGTDPTLKVPSGKIKLLLPDFEIEEEGDEADITVEFDVEESFVKAGKSGKYIFKPTVRARSVEVNGEDRNENVETAGQVTAYTEGESVAVEGIEFAITGDTEIDEELALEEGQGVEIEGARSETGAEYVAQEIKARSGEEKEEGAVLEAPLEEVRPGESSIVLVGTPFAIDADTKFEGFNVLSELEGGSRAEVVFAYDAASGTYRALEIESESSGEGEDDKGGEGDDDENEDNEEAAEVKGRVTSAPADGSVAVEGLGFAVTGGTVTGGTEAGDGGLEAITEGDFVELEATYTSGGTLVATEVEKEEEPDGQAATLEAALNSVSPDAITLLGASFAVSENTQLDDFDALEELEQGDEVEVEFAYDAEADTYRALKIESDGSGRNDE